jgi:hypothetical protein
MADGVAKPVIHLSTLDPGIGKTQSVVQFLPVLLASGRHREVGVIICAQRKDQIRQMIEDAKEAGLTEADYAVHISEHGSNEDKDLHAAGLGMANRQHARVLFTTHAMVMRRCGDAGLFAKATDFHYHNAPREVRVWDEAITPGLAVTVARYDLMSLIKPVSRCNIRLAAQIDGLAKDLDNRSDGEQFIVPDIVLECGCDLNDLVGFFEGAPADQKDAANALWFLCGKTVTVRKDYMGVNTMLDYRETLPPDLAPVLVLDASARRGGRGTYDLWETYRGDIIRLAEATKDYSPLTIHYWETSGSKTAFKDRDSRETLIQGIGNTVNAKPDKKWLVVHHKDDRFENEVRRSLNASAADVSFLPWGRHDATNAYVDRPNVILAGTLFFRPSQYEALGRASAGIPSSAGPFPKKLFDVVVRGEHRHLILQAACRGAIRKCDGDKCPPANLYIIASRGSGIGKDLPNIFPGARVVKWQPVSAELKGQVGAAAAYIIERTRTGEFVSDADVREHLGIKDKAQYRRRVKKHPDLKVALAEHDIEPCSHGQRTGYQKTFNLSIRKPSRK